VSMAMALEGTRDFLRAHASAPWAAVSDENKVKHCGIQDRGFPPPMAPAFYVALDDAGVESGPENNDYLKEILNIEVSVWREASRTPKDYRGKLFTKDDLYLSQIYTISDLERFVLAVLHRSFTLRVAINDQFDLPNVARQEQGFEGCLMYRGRARAEVAVDTDSGNSREFIGMRLRFRGLHRNQYIGSIA
jgi:hypothetical protein